MAFSSGVYTLPGAALSTGDTVSATDHNQVRNDMATAFNLTWLRNGTATATANIPMGGYKLTGLGVATTSGDALSYGQAATVSDLTSSGTQTFSGGTANGVAYLNGSKVLTTGSALTYDGATLTNSAGSTATALSLNSTNGTYGLDTQYKYNGTAIGSIGSSKGIDSTGNLTDLGINSAANLDFATGFTRRMRLDSSGNLGLGVTPSAWSIGKNIDFGPTGAIDSDGYTRIIDNAYYNAAWKTKTTGQSSYYQMGAGVHTWFQAPSVTAGSTPTFTQAMTLDASGKLFLNGTNVPYSGISAQLVINSTLNSGFFNITSVVQSTVNQGHINFVNNNGNVGSISTSGSLTSYNVTSDQRLKENIVNAPDFGSVIDSIQVRSFDWKTGNTHQRAGFIAQELVTVAPEAVYQPQDSEQMMAVDYSKLVPMLVKEIQSLRQRVATLEA
jgi:hypothetical protein